MRTKYLFVLIHISLRVGLVPSNMLKLSGVASFVDFCCYLCFTCVFCYAVMSVPCSLMIIC